ncbi:MAG TPA: phosphoribosylanthranilate isomerase [Thermoleophilaceae bacterium]
MRPPAHTRVKVCCMKSIEEVWMAIDAGASAVGLVSPMPTGPGPISNERAAEIAAEVPPGIDAFLLTPLQDVDELVEQNRLVKARALQLVDALAPGAHAELRSAMPGVRLVQVIHVTGAESVEEAATVAPDVDAILLDSGNPSLEVKELGGTGRRHDWALSREIRERVDVPVWLAGGLNPDNAREAIETVGPFALDVCSGLRTREGYDLDPDKLERFMAAVR